MAEPAIQFKADAMPLVGTNLSLLPASLEYP